MSAEPLEHFRAFITESFTAAAVNIFSEVQSLVQFYENENKRLRTLLQSVLQPQVQLSRIDVGSFSPSAPTGSGLQDRASGEGEELKEEQMECVISGDVMDPIKSEPDVVLISDRLVDIPCSSDAASAPASEADGDDSESEDDVGDTGEEEATASGDSGGTRAAKKEPPQQKTLLECPRFKKPDNTFLPTKSEYKAFVSRLTGLYKDMPAEQRPLIALMGLDQDQEFVDCALGKVPKGCPLSYHHPLPSEGDFRPLDDAPPQPRLPLQSQIVPPSNAPALQASEQDAVDGMALTWEASHTLEQSTRQDKDVGGEVKGRRLLDCFAGVLSLRENVEGSAERLVSKIRRGKRKRKHATIEEETRAEALREYCRLVCVNWYPCGLVVHPGAPWLAARPDGLVYDPKEAISFGIVRVKCEALRSFTECRFVAFREGALRVNAKSPCYGQVQGELMVTGTPWCDLLVFCGEDMLVQRIYRDEALIGVLKNKLDRFFFQNYLPSLCTREED